MDGPLPGGKPKLLELFVQSSIDDLSQYAIGSANNGGGTDGPEFILSGVAQAGDYIYISTDASFFNYWFGFSPDFSTSVININGNDAIELFYDTSSYFLGSEQLIDVFGQADSNGSGAFWDYMDSWAVRIPSANATTDFDSLDWIFGGINRLDPYSNSNHLASDSDAFPIQSYALVFNGASWNSTFNPNGIASSNVILPDTFLGDIFIQSGQAELKCVQARSLNILDTAHLIIQNTLTLDDTLVLNLSTDQYPQIKGSLLSPIKVKTTLKSDSLNRWFNLGFPLSTTWQSLLNQQGVSPLFKADSINNLYSFKNQKWSRITSFDDSILPIGYSLFLGLPYFDSLPVELELSGQAYSNDFSISLDTTSTDKWNFLANPFLAQISWSKHLVNNPKLDQTYYVHDDERNLWYSYNPWIPKELQNSELGDQIPPMQSFFVKSDSAEEIHWSQGTIEMESIVKRYKTLQEVLGIELYIEDSIISRVALAFNNSSVQENQKRDSELRLSPGQKAEIAFSVSGLDYQNKFISQSSIQEIPLKIIGQEPSVELRLKTSYINKERHFFIKNNKGDFLHDFSTGAFVINRIDSDFEELVLCWNDFLELGKDNLFEMDYSYQSGFLQLEFNADAYVNEVKLISLDSRIIKSMSPRRYLSNLKIPFQQTKSQILVLQIETKDFGLITKKIFLP